MAIVIRFIAETGSYIEGVNKALKKTEVFSKKSVEEFRTVTNAVGKWAAATAAAMAGVGLAISKESAESAKQLKTLSQVANESIEDFQRYSHAVKSVGIEQDKFADILKDVNDKIGDFNQASAGGMVDFFEQIAPKVGVTRKEFEGLSGRQALQLYISSLEKANVSQADMTFYMEAIAGDATALLPLFRDNGKELNRLAQEADNLGLVLSDIDVQRLAQMGSSFDNIAAKVDVVKKQIALGLMPVITAVADRILDSSNEMGGFEQMTVNVLNASTSAIGPFLDAWHAVKIALAGVATGTHFMYTGFKSLFTWLIDVSAHWVDQFTGGINLIIKNINSINPFKQIPLIDTVSDSDFMKGLRTSQAETEQIFAMMSQDFQALLMEQLPSGQLKQFVADAIEQSKVLRSEMQAGGSSGGSVGDGGVDENEAERKRRQERLALIRESLTEEEELLKFDLNQKREQLLIALQQNIIDEEDYRVLSIAAEKKYMEDLYNLRKEGYDGMNELIKEHYGFAASETAGAFRSILDTASQGSKKLFKINQIFAISDALISTYQGIAAGVKLGWPQAIPAVAWAAANGFAQVSKIKSMSYGKSGGGGSGSGGGSEGGSSSAAAAPPPNTFNVSLSGISPDQMFSGRQLGGLVDLINEEIRSGSRLEGISI